jgi:hypothetical protein
MKKTHYICNDCGSENLHFNGVVTWNYKDQDWIVDEVYSMQFDDVYCEQCEEMVDSKEVQE